MNATSSMLYPYNLGTSTSAKFIVYQLMTTTTQLTSVVHDWSPILQKCSQVDIVFLDFQKAFDRVPHQRLRSKLEYYGVIGDSQAWIMSLLCNRKQAVVVDGSRSSWRDVTSASGVPQGSVIGPTLFLLYINDIQDNIQSPMKLFADDCAIYREICKEDDHQALQRDLQCLSTWSSDWLMNFNIKKCAILSITRKRKSRIHEYQLLNEVIPRVNQYKYLGVMITSNLRWNKHCQTIQTKLAVPWASFVEHYHHALRKWRPRLILHLFAPSWNMVQKHGTPTTSLLLMGWSKFIQKAAARFVCSDYRYSTSSSSLVSSLKWDCLHTRRILTQCTLFYKIQNQLVATPFPPIVSPATYYGRYDHNLKYAVPAATIDV